MKKRLLALLLMLALVLSGCSGIKDMLVTEPEEEEIVYTPFSEMEYTRPDMTAFQQTLDDAMDKAENGQSLEEVADSVEAFNIAFNSFVTNHSLAYVYYCADMTDQYWEEEYDYCAEKLTDLEAGLDQLYHLLAKSPYREELEGEDYFGEGYFDDYEGESVWDETYTALAAEETALVDEYYDLSALGLEMDPSSRDYYNKVARPLADLYVKLVAKRQEMAAYLGYDSYAEYAYDFIYERDYTPKQAAAYMKQIQKELGPMYLKLSWGDSQSVLSAECTQEEMLAYTQGCAESMGGLVLEAFQTMQEYGLYDITYSDNKYNASFETYLPDYNTPFVFVNPQGTGNDKLTLTHEFGHFANDYACVGSGSGIDVAEVFSQGMEYLSLFYAEGGQELTTARMLDSMAVFVEQTLFADFERRVYELEGTDLNVANVFTAFEDAAEASGLGSWGLSGIAFVQIPHFFTSPMYVISYVVSNDAAFQLYQLEAAEVGAGLAVFEQALSTTEEGFLGFVESVGLRSPFEEGSVALVRQSMEELLK